MAENAGGAVLITGANSGIGKEVARQLAMRGDVEAIYLACRNETKAELARTDLESATGKSIFTTVPMDTSSPDSVNAAVDHLIDTPLRAVVMNAGGMGGPDPQAKTVDGVTEIFASNVLGHVVLLDRLIADRALTSTAIMVGSEAARGVRQLGIKRPTFTDHSVDEFASVIDGSYFDSRKVDGGLAYAQVKYLAALWISDLAQQHPGLRLLTISPGNTSGTDVFREMPVPIRMLLNRVLMPVVFPRIGLAHSVGDGAARLADGVVNDDMASGVFYASADNKLTGPVVDQAGIMPDFADPTIQRNANEAIHRFVS
jgi:NAD(P)-dependent dehydrogenase (short-subunit alcohol dehydrogenase family)